MSLLKKVGCQIVLFRNGGKYGFNDYSISGVNTNKFEPTWCYWFCGSDGDDLCLNGTQYDVITLKL